MLIASVESRLTAELKLSTSSEKKLDKMYLCW
jgi:hypothetical protein